MIWNLTTLADFEERQFRKNNIKLGDKVTLHIFSQEKTDAPKFEVVEICKRDGTYRVRTVGHKNADYDFYVCHEEILDVVHKAGIKINDNSTRQGNSS